MEGGTLPSTAASSSASDARDASAADRRNLSSDDHVLGSHPPKQRPGTETTLEHESEMGTTTYPNPRDGSRAMCPFTHDGAKFEKDEREGDAARRAEASSDSDERED